MARRSRLGALTFAGLLFQLGCDRPTQPAANEPGPVSASVTIAPHIPTLNESTLLSERLKVRKSVQAASGENVIDFEGLASGTSIGSTYSTAYGFTMSGAVILVAGGSLNSPYVPRSGSNVVFDITGTIEVTFEKTARSVGGYITGNRVITLTCYKADGTSLGAVSTPGANYTGAGTGLPLNIPLFISAVAIKRCQFVGGGNTFTLDDLTFQPDCSVDVAPQFQANPLWADSIIGVGPDKMRGQGCAITSLAMALGHQGVPYSAGQLNTALKILSGTLSPVTNGLVWPKATAAASGNGLRFEGVRSAAEMEKALCAGYPVIVEVPGIRGGTHFVLVTGKEGDNYKVNNPGGGATSMSATTIRSYRGAVVPAASGIPWSRSMSFGGTRGLVQLAVVAPDLVLYVNDATFLVTDGTGKRVGWIPGSADPIREIAEPELWLDAIENDETGAAAEHFLSQLQWPGAPVGSFDLQVNPERDGVVEFFAQSIHYGETEQPPIFKIDLFGVAGRTIQLHITIDSDGGAVVTRDGNPNSTRDDIEGAARLGELSSDGVRNALLQQVSAIQAALARGNTKVALNVLDAFESLVRAQRGKSLSQMGADVLAADAAAMRGAIH